MDVPIIQILNIVSVNGIKEAKVTEDERVKEIEKKLNAYLATSGREDFLVLDIKEGKYLLSLLDRRSIESVLGEFLYGSCLTCRLAKRVKELEESRDDWKKSWELEMAHSKQCEKIIKELNRQYNETCVYFNKEQIRVKELKEGIEKHKEITLGYDSGIPEADAELYKLVENK
jgi:phosphatidate phosphatase PAH1